MSGQTHLGAPFTPLTAFLPCFHATITATANSQPNFRQITDPKMKRLTLAKLIRISLVWIHTVCLMSSQTHLRSPFTPLTPYLTRFYATIKANRQPNFTQITYPHLKGLTLANHIRVSHVWIHTDCLMSSQTHLGGRFTPLTPFLLRLAKSQVSWCMWEGCAYLGKEISKREQRELFISIDLFSTII